MSVSVFLDSRHEHKGRPPGSLTVYFDWPPGEDGSTDGTRFSSQKQCHQSELLVHESDLGGPIWANDGSGVVEIVQRGHIFRFAGCRPTGKVAAAA